MPKQLVQKHESKSVSDKVQLPNKTKFVAHLSSTTDIACFKVTIYYDLTKKIWIGTSLNVDFFYQLKQMLIGYVDIFAWSHVDMLSIDPLIICHKLSVNSNFKLVVKSNGILVKINIKLLKKKSTSYSSLIH